MTPALPAPPEALISRAADAVSQAAGGGFLFDCPAGALRRRNRPFSWAGGAALFGWDPFCCLTLDGGPGNDALAELDRFLAVVRDRAAIVAGWLSYDLGEKIEPTVVSRHPADAMPLLHFAAYERYYRYEPAAGSLSECGPFGPKASSGVAWPSSCPRGRRERGIKTGEVASNFDAHAYAQAVFRAREYILSGDIFEVNLSQRFSLPWDRHPADLYLRLRKANAAPYCAFLSSPCGAIMSSSPELFLSVDGNRVITRPIKGTARRAAGRSGDARAARALAASPKDNAELVMIVDLERNDLGRVCQYGAVRVTEAARVETFARVHHLVATVEGLLRPGVTLGELFRATFPGGSITGAPKVRAMQIIDELERSRRGVYTGAMGYVLPGGRAEFNIAIRTLVHSGATLSFSAGGAVTAESVPEKEYDETLAKAEAMLAAVCASR